MDERNAFLQEIIEHPEDDAPRLVFADWLADHGEEDRAEFIRVQCEIARTPANDPRREKLTKRAEKLEKAHKREWLRPLHEAITQSRCIPPSMCRGIFRRGFLNELSISPRKAGFPSVAHDFLSTQPVQELGITGCPALGHTVSLMELADASCLRALRRVSLCGGPDPSAEALHRLGSSPHLPRLADLHAAFGVSAQVLAGLVDTPMAARLQSLSIHLVPGDGPEMAALLADAPRFPSLSYLSCPLRADEVEKLAHSSNLPALESLHVWAGFESRGLTSLLESPLWKRLTGFWLYYAAFGDAEVQPLLRALPSSKLRQFRLGYMNLTSATVAALVGLPSWGDLQELWLDGNPIGDEGVIALARSPHLAKLRKLCLWGCSFSDAGAMELASSPHAGNLQWVYLYESKISKGVQKALKKRFGGAFRFGVTS